MTTATTNIHIIHTGGTIGMVDSPHGLVPGPDIEKRFADLLAGTEFDGRVSSIVLDPPIDSSNATPDSWRAIIEEIEKSDGDGQTRTDAPRAHVVVHGTDTMAYTAAALSYALAGRDRGPVVLTGSQLPLRATGSDAPANVMGALRAAADPRTEGVCLFFGRHLLAGNRVSKASSWAFDGFESPNAEPLAVAGAPWRWTSRPLGGSGWDHPLPYRRHDVVVLDLVPGITAARLEATLTPLPDAVVLRGHGTGNVPGAEPGLVDVVADAVRAGTAVVVSSQCRQADVALGLYETGDAIARAGAVGSGDMTPEATYAKIQFLLSQGLRGADLAAHLGRSIAGEITERTDAGH